MTSQEEREHLCSPESPPHLAESLEQQERRNFLISLGKWSKAVIGGVALSELLSPDAQAQALGWANSRDGGRTWINVGGWPPPVWYDGWNNRPWFNRWHNRPWYNGDGWYNGGWQNRRWKNRGGWHNHDWKEDGGDWQNRGGDWLNRSWHNR